MKVGVYVGSFNPPHKGHKKIVDYLLEKKYIDKIIVIPTKTYWDKNNLIDIEHRVNMWKTYIDKNITVENSLSKYEYTYQIIEELRKKYKNLYLIIGADNLEKFHMWKNVEKILQNNIIVINRSNINTLNYINKFKEKDKFIVINDLEQINISSTYIRKNIKNKKILSVLDKNVLKYIIDNNLYEVNNE